MCVGREGCGVAHCEARESKRNAPFKFKIRNVAGGTSDSVANAIQMTPYNSQTMISTQHKRADVE